MAIEKPLVPGSNNGAIPPEAIEVIIEGEPTTTAEEDGGFTVDFGTDGEAGPVAGHNDNLVDFIENSDLDELSSDLLADFDADDQSRSEWKDSYIKGLDLLGLKFEDRTKPWDGACGVFHPLLAEKFYHHIRQAIPQLHNFQVSSSR